MFENTGFIILRDVPKEKAQLNLTVYDIEGGFRGFQLVPSGVNYCAIKDDEKFVGFWCYLSPKDAIVKVYNYDFHQFEDDTPESTEHYKGLAMSNSMANVLIPYSHGHIWSSLINYINADNFPPKLNKNLTMMPPLDLPLKKHKKWMEENFKSRFELAFLETHKGNIPSFLSEFQFAFVRFIVTGDDEEAFKRWRHLLSSIYNAGEHSIEDNSELFEKIVDVLIPQFENLSDEMFVSNSFVVENSDYLAEDMIDTHIDKLVEKGKNFKNYMKKRTSK